MGLVKNILYKISVKPLFNFVKKENIFTYYHIINNKKTPHVTNLYKYKNIETFISDLDFLTKNYSTLTPKELLNNKTNYNNSFLLSFDDGLSEVYNIIYPILKQRKIPAIFFINPDFIDNKSILYKHIVSILIEQFKTQQLLPNIKELLSETLGVKNDNDIISSIRNIKKTEFEKINTISKLLEIDTSEFLLTHSPYITTEQINEMINEGYYIGAHTMSHPRLTELPLNEQKSEILDSIKWVKSKFNLEYTFFAFPFSDKGISREIFNEIFEYDPKSIVFGNSGLKKDFHPRIIQRFSLENPSKKIHKTVISENLYKYYNKIIGKYQIKRK